jgi:hypothetical protein
MFGFGFGFGTAVECGMMELTKAKPKRHLVLVQTHREGLTTHNSALQNIIFLLPELME